MRTGPISAAAIVLGVSSATFGASLEYIGQGIGITDMSRDGRVLVGNTINDAAYETWRWVAGDPTGWHRLGLATVPVFTVGAGTPDVSYDGTRVSATIVGGTSSGSRTEPYGTAGLWTLGLGWTEAYPPLPVGCILLDWNYGSAWGLSGDGTIVSGFYWRDTQGGALGLAAPCTTTTGGATTALPTPSGSSGRVNALSYDGSVAVGWDERVDGVWHPVAWRNGVRMVLTDTEAFCSAEAVTADGSVIVGTTYNVNTVRVEPARWDWNGSAYVETNLGVLPGTPQTWIAYVYASSVSDDGTIIVGTNRFQNNGPYSNQTGFVWTQADGMRSITQVLTDHGLALPPDIRVVDLAVSPDGSAIGILGLNLAETQFLDYHSYLFRYTPLSSCAGDVTGDGLTNTADFNVVASNFGAGPGMSREAGDLTGDGFVNAADFNVLAGDFGCAPAN